MCCRKKYVSVEIRQGTQNIGGAHKNQEVLHQKKYCTPEEGENVGHAYPKLNKMYPPWIEGLEIRHSIGEGGKPSQILFRYIK